MSGDLLTPTQVADILHVTPTTVNRWIRSGKMRAIQLPSGSYRVPAADVDAIFLTLAAQ